MTEPTITEFLLARIAEDEIAARAALQRGSLVYDWAVLRDLHFILADSQHIPRWKPARVLAECEAKRRIVENEWAHWGMTNTLKFLALPHADHPDYREEWKP